MAELVEHETEAWYKMDPDPFDYRHPGKGKLRNTNVIFSLSLLTVSYDPYLYNFIDMYVPCIRVLAEI